MRSPKLILDISQSQMENLSIDCSNFIPRMIKMEPTDEYFDTNNNYSERNTDSSDLYMVLNVNNQSQNMNAKSGYTGNYMQIPQSYSQTHPILIEDLNLPRNDILESAVPAANFTDFGVQPTKKRKYNKLKSNLNNYFNNNYSSSSTDSGISENKKFRFDENEFDKGTVTPTTLYKYNDKYYDESSNNNYYQNQHQQQPCDIKQYQSTCDIKYTSLDENSASPQFAPYYYENNLSNHSNQDQNNSQNLNNVTNDPNTLQQMNYYCESNVPLPALEVTPEKTITKKFLKMKENMMKIARRQKRKKSPEDAANKPTRVMANVRERQRTQR